MSADNRRASRCRDPLPVPDGGWRSVLVQAIVVMASWAIASFAMTALLLPTMDPECYSDGTSTTICPFPESRNPALTNLFDALWPLVDEWNVLFLIIAMLAMFIAIGIAIFLSTTDPWEHTGGAPDTLALFAGLAGVGLGLVVSGPGFTRPLIALGLTCAGLLVCLCAGLGLRHFARSLRRRNVEHLRRVHLRQHGTRILAHVTGFDWLQGGGTSDSLVFDVTARLDGHLDENERVVTGVLRTPRQDAPVVGGTVVIYTDGQRNHATGIDFVMQPDPDSIRDPDAESRYPESW